MSATKVYEQLAEHFISDCPVKTSKSRWFAYRDDKMVGSEDFSFNAPEGLQFDKLFGYFNPDKIIAAETLSNGNIVVKVTNDDKSHVMTYVGVYDK